MSTTTRSAPALTRAPDFDDRPGMRVWTVTVGGRAIGIVGDTRPWRGSRFGSLRWWAALRDTDDPRVPAQWNTGDDNLTTRKAALQALVARWARHGFAPAAPIRIAIDADCPRCGYGERFFEPDRGVFGCSSLNPTPCGYESTEREA